PAQDARGPEPGDARGYRPAPRQGRLRAAVALPVSPEVSETIGAGMRRKLAGFARTLRDNGFKVGLNETRDALAILASPAAARASALQPALKSLFCATHSDWQRFDEIFAAYWLGRGMRRAVTLRGTPSKRGASLTRQAPGDASLNAPKAADRVERDQAATASAAGTGRREGASATELLSTADLRH